MKITDCTLRTRNIVAGVVFCILFAILWTFLAMPVDVSARTSNETILDTGESKADDSMNGTTLVFPEGKATFDLNGREISVTSIAAQNAEVTITGKGTLTVSSVIRMPDSTLRVNLDERGRLETNGIYMKAGTLVLEGGDISLKGSYTHAESIRVSGGNVVADTRADGLRADGSFQMTGGTVTAHGRTHGLHAEGSVDVTDGVLTMSGGNSAFYFAHPELVRIDGVPVAAGQNEGSASAMESVTSADGRAFVQIGTPGRASAKANAAAGTGTTKKAGAAAGTDTTKKAEAAAGRDTTKEATTERTAESAKEAAAEATIETTAETETTTEAAEEATTTEVIAETTTEITAEATAEAIAETTTEATTEATAATSETSAALPVSAAGNADATSSSAAATGATSFTAPATADSGMLGKGVVLLGAVIAGLLVLIRIPE